LEQRLGVSLPTDYRRFLLEVNGGNPAEDVRLAQLSAGRPDVNWLLSVDQENLSRDLESSAEWSRRLLPHADLLLIGFADIGMVLLVHAGPHRGEVWLQDTGDSDMYIEPDDPDALWHDRRDMEKLADSFEEFMSGLVQLSKSA